MSSSRDFQSRSNDCSRGKAPSLRGGHRGGFYRADRSSYENNIVVLLINTATPMATIILSISGRERQDDSTRDAELVALMGLENQDIKILAFQLSESLNSEHAYIRLVEEKKRRVSGSLI